MEHVFTESMFLVGFVIFIAAILVLDMLVIDRKAHVVSNAYVKSPEAQVHNGFSAGSYKDLTRVAKLNADMWTELFLDNDDNLLREVEGIIAHLQEYADALRARDAETLHALLKAGSDRKEEIDGKG